MGLRDSLKSLGLTAAGAAFELAQGGISFAQASLGEFEKADQAPKGEGDGDKTKAPKQAGGGMVPSDDDLAIPDANSMLWDPFAIVEQLGYKERPSQITYGTLRSILYKMPVVSDIIFTRLNQIASFARPQHDRYSMGFRLKLRDTESNPTKQDKKWIKSMEDLIMHTGVHDDPRHRDNFEQFLRKSMRNSFTYDQMAWEIVPNRKGQPAQWYVVDASTIRLADTASAYQKKNLRSDTKYVQIYDGMIITEYTAEDMCFGVRNPASDIRLFGYGTPEIELVMNTITSLLWGHEYNRKFFSQGSAAKGILNFEGTIPEHQLKGFRRQWYNLISGVENAWKTPITNADKLTWIPLQENNKDMEFSAWMDWNIKVCCAAFQMNPAEINFQYGNSGQKSAMGEANNKEKITESRVRGLTPVLRFLADNINEHIIWPTNPNYEFEFVGLNAGTHLEVATLNQTLVKTTRTIDELRAEDDLDPLPDGAGEIILDPTYLQFVTAKQQAEMAEEQGGEFGGDESGGFGGDESGDGQDQDMGDEAAKFDFDSLFGKEGGDKAKPDDAEKSMTKSLVEIEL